MTKINTAVNGPEAAWSFPHEVTRLEFDVGQPYEKFRSRFEAVVPAPDRWWFSVAAGRHARPVRITADEAVKSPHGFALCWRAEMPPLMATAGDCRPWTAYLLTSQAVAEDIGGRHPAMMLYLPLRALIYIGCDDRTRFAVDQPSTALSGFADPAIAQAGLGLDRQLAELLDGLGIQARHALSARSGPSGKSSLEHRPVRLSATA